MSDTRIRQGINPSADETLLPGHSKTKHEKTETDNSVDQFSYLKKKQRTTDTCQVPRIDISLLAV